MFCTGLDKVPGVFIEILCPKDSVPLPALAGGTENSWYGQEAVLGLSSALFLSWVSYIEYDEYKQNLKFVDVL